MSLYENISELFQNVLGWNCSVEAMAADGTKGRGSEQTRFKCINANGDMSSDIKWVFAKRNDLNSSVNESLHVVEKETVMYDEIIPQFLNFAGQKSVKLKSELMLGFLEYYGHGIVNRKHIFLFEDLNNSSGKYKIASSDSFHDSATVHIVLEQLGKLHGVSYSMKQEGVSFKRHSHLTKHYLYSEQGRSLAAPFYNGEFLKTAKVLKVLLSCYRKCPELLQNKIDLCEAMLPKTAQSLNKLMSLVPDPLKLHQDIEAGIDIDKSVLIHGDFHPLNIAFSSDAVKFFDFQLIRYSDGILDIHQYICQATTPDQRANNLESFLKTYFNSVTKTCCMLGKESLPYKDIQDFRRRFDQLAPWQIPFGFGFLLWKFVTNQEAYSQLSSFLASNRASEAEGCYENVVEMLNELGPKIWSAINILLQYVVELEENGILDFIK